MAITQNKKVHYVSCKKEKGIRKLSTSISTFVEDFLDTFLNKTDGLITERQKNKLDLFVVSLGGCIKLLDDVDDMVVVASYLRESLLLLREVNSPVGRDDVVDNVFREFCVGK